MVSSSLIVLLAVFLEYQGHHHRDGRRTTRYFTFAPCTGTPAYDNALALTLRVSPPWYLVFTVGNSTLKVGRLYSSTRILLLYPLVLMKYDPEIPLSGRLNSTLMVPNLSVVASCSSMILLLVSRSSRVKLLPSSEWAFVHESLAYTIAATFTFCPGR